MFLRYRRRSSYSGLALMGSHQKGVFRWTGPKLVSTVVIDRSSAILSMVYRLRPKVEVSRSTSSTRLASVSGEQSMDKVMAGRDFFMTIGVSHTSCAPASKKRSKRYP